MRRFGAYFVVLGNWALGSLVGCGADRETILLENVGGSGGAGGTSSTLENPCGDVDPSLGDADADELFYADAIATFDLYLPEASWQWLNEHAVDEEYVEAQACYNGRAVGTVGLRFKGSYGSLYTCFNEQNENVCRKLSMKLKFDEYTDEQRFFGLKRLNFQGYRYDDSYLKERLSYDLFREMGLEAPRASWAILRVNGEMQGLFGMVEQLDGRFTKDRWPDNGDGNLFKEIWPGQEDEAQIIAGLETNEDAPDVDAMRAFSVALNAANEDELRDTLGQYVDLEYLAYYMAVDDAIADFDGVTTFYTSGNPDEAGNHNFYFYQEADDRFTIIPWDLEATLSLYSGFGYVPEWQTKPDDCALTYPVWSGENQVIAPGCDRTFRALAQDLSDYRVAADTLLAGPFALEHMRDHIESYAEFIRAEATADPNGPGATAFENAVGFLSQEIPRLRARLEHLISGEPTIPVTLDVAQDNGFEAADDYGLSAGTTLLSNAHTTASVQVNRDEPLEGNQSIRYSFSFGNESTAWQQWSFYAIPFVTVPADLSPFTGIRVTLRSNVARTVRLDLKSPNNSLGDEGVQVGWDVPVTTTGQAIEVTLANARVPGWATDPGDDLSAILQTVTALSFQPNCVGLDATGQLPTGVTDEGWLDIDSVEFF